MTLAPQSPERRPQEQRLPQERELLTDDDLVTGDAVALDLPAAGLGMRLLSGLIDVLVTCVLLVVFLILFMTATFDTDEALAWAAYIAATAAVLVVLPTAIETLTRGRSLGKLTLGLRTVRDDGGAISFHHAFVRALVGVVEIYGTSGAAALITAMIHPRGKRLGDIAAGTYVIRVRVPLSPPAPVQMPPPLAAWASRADVAALPVGLSLAVRRFLSGEVGTYTDPERRHALAERLATQVQTYVAPGPPPGTPPEAYLAAVLASRRDRDAARLARDNDLRTRLTSRS
ncbi:RDD family protein [Nocardioides panzhihuensis]|uniref:Putative RDD family membrane protein YckC n=1 Tax=Nocardioides panzhihuensis TaxID=860243 RepID=A0A7Z0ITQ6_9ACTN|nr:RDD family protein [Nocardioides panzhihuensis]NYI79399.1 putative RDD family membrane protein YckC [Nocardioides panzhihuensis]